MLRPTISRRCRVLAASLSVMLPLIAASAQAATVPVPSPTVTRAPEAGSPWSAATLDLKAGGYVEEEYILEGTARSHVASVNFTDSRDGEWDATPTGPTAPYKVRVLVERPRDPARFNGMVVVEWLNVSAMRDGGSFSSFGEWIMRQGYAYVGVSAQVAGVNHLRGHNAERYGALVHPGDTFSYDIFSQAAQAIRGGALLGDSTKRVRALVATGGSQSGARLITYINAAHPTAGVYDAFIPYVTGWSSPLTQDPSASLAVGGVPTSGPNGAALRVRTDIKTPVLVENSENEAKLSARGLHRQPDSATFRLWEYAGTSHASSGTSTALGMRRDPPPGAPASPLVCENPPPNGLNAAPIWRAMLTAMRVWVLDGRAPRSAPRLEISVPEDAAQPVAIVRDPATGIARGGIRLPQIAAPTATRWGERRPGGKENSSCNLYGASDPWNGNGDAWDNGPNDISPNPEPSLRALYRDTAGYVKAIRDSANRLVSQGWLLKEDAEPMLEEAKTVQIN